MTTFRERARSAWPCAKLIPIHWSTRPPIIGLPSHIERGEQGYFSENPTQGSNPGRMHDWRGSQALCQCVTPPSLLPPLLLRSQQTWDIYPLLDQCWASVVVDAGPTSIQQWINIRWVRHDLDRMLTFYVKGTIEGGYGSAEACKDSAGKQ